MQDRVITLTERFERGWLYRWPGLLVAWIVTVAGSMYVLTLPDYYESTATVSIILDDFEVPQAVSKAQRELLSEENVRRVLKDVEIEGLSNSPADFQRAKEALVSRVRLDGVGTDSFTMICRDTERDRARDICSLLLQAFEDNVAYNFNERLKSLQSELETLRTDAGEAEQNLLSFRKQNRSVFGQGDLEQRLNAAIATLDEARSSYAAAVKLRDELRADYLSDAGADSEVMRSSMPQAPGNTQILRLYTLFSQLETLRASYSNSHPDVITVRRELEAIVRQYPPNIRMCSGQGRGALEVDAQAIERLDLVVISVVAANILVCDAESSLIQAEIEVNSVSDARDAALPAEQELQRLTQVRDSLRARIEIVNNELLEIGRDDGLQRYVIVDAPRLASEPSNTDPRVLLMGALLLGVGAGVGIAYFFGSSSQTFLQAVDVESTFALPFYGTVSRVNGGLVSGLDRSAQALAFILLAGLLIAMMLVLVVIEPALPAIQGMISNMLMPFSNVSERL